ncbi:MAG TPA: hypothetical protein VIN70_09870 [Candidatus Limnocylindria bacterium]|jgi:hypothetical protein
MLRTTVAFVLALMIGAFALPAATAAAAEPTFAPSATVQTTCDATSTRGGAAGLIAAVVQAAVNACDVRILNNSVNNLLQNADIHVLENILNNSPILSGITVQNIDVNVLTGTTTITLLGGQVLVLTP